MRLKNLLLSLFFTIFPIYFFCLFDLILSSEFLNIRFRKSTKKQAVELIKKGYIPSFIPTELVDKNFDSFSDNNLYPIGSLPNKDSFLCDEGYGLIKYKSDRFGLRNPDINWDRAFNSNTIYFVGDSFTQGFCVEEEETITGRIESISQQNVLSLGFGANSPIEYIALLNTIVNPIILNSSSLENDVVIVFYENDNIKENKKKLNLALSANNVVRQFKNKGYRPSQEYVKAITNTIYENYSLEKKELILNLQKQMQKNWKSNNLPYQILTMYPIRKRIKFLFKEYNEKQTYAPSISKSIFFLSKICKGSCKPHVIFIPANVAKYPQLKINESFFINYLEKKALNYNINFIDGREVIDTSLPENYSAQGDHLSPEGYRKIADLFIKRR